MKIDRRRALTWLGVGAAAAPGAAAGATAQIIPTSFDCGVASGDPLSDRVVLWTHVRCDADAVVPVQWMVSATPDFAALVARGVVQASAERDHTVKVEAGSLKPGTDYFYRFKFGDGADAITSPVGRARTLPVGATADVVMAVASCSLYPGGYFNAYQAIADLPRVDVVLHLGDYIYEYGADGYGAETGKALNRLPDPPHECVSLQDYRRRHACHRRDAQLQAAHARAPWILVWDDHETANDSWTGGAENHNPDKGEGDWATRKAAAIRAFYEWMPIREPARDKAGFQAWRAFRFGDLATLIMTETRLTARSHQLGFSELPQTAGVVEARAFLARLRDPARRMMGPDQHAFLKAELAASAKAGQPWQVIGNQVVMARVFAPDILAGMSEARKTALDKELGDGGRRRIERLTRLSSLGLPYNLDAWDGYPADRERLYDSFKATGAHPIVLSGDSHVFWVNELWDGGGKTRVAAELGTTGVTSPGAGDALKSVPIGQAFADHNKEVIHTDQAAKGFLLLTLTHAAARAELICVSTILEKVFLTEARKTFEITPAKGAGVEAIREI